MDLRLASEPTRIVYEPVWYPPLRLAPDQCNDCTLLLAGGDPSDPGIPPALPEESDLYKEEGLRRAAASNSTWQEHDKPQHSAEQADGQASGPINRYA